MPHINRGKLQHTALKNEEVIHTDTKQYMMKIKYAVNKMNLTCIYRTVDSSTKNIHSSQKFTEPSPKLTIYSIELALMDSRK